MKVYSSPISIPEADYSSYQETIKREREFMDNLESWGRAHGYDGPATGNLIRFLVGDGYAEYMIMQGSRISCLIHLDIGSGYHSELASVLPKKEIFRRMICRHDESPIMLKY